MTKYIKNINSSISGSKQVNKAYISSSLIKLFVDLSEILNTFFSSFFSNLSQVAQKYSSHILLPISSKDNRLLPETHNLFHLDTILSQVANTYSSQILHPSSSQNNRTLPEIKYKKY